jgi:methylmalonyl-CoA mutase
MPADDVCERMSFFFGVGMDFYVEVAKLRAARLLWSEIAMQRGATSNRARALRMHCQTSGWSLTAQKPMNNIVRTTVEALAAIFGGTQSLHTNAYDEALALPSASSARLARDTQLVLQDETGVCDVADPWAGSYMMEALTADIASRARALLAEVDARGGIVETIRSGWINERIRESALAVQAEIEGGQRAIVGVNRFVADDDDNDEHVACRSLDAKEIRRQQALRIAHVQSTRDAQRVRKTLDALARAARDGTGNLLELTIECMRARATVGECTRALEAVWPRHSVNLHAARGTYRDTLSDDPIWQDACDEVSRATAALGRAPRILIAKLGQDGHDRGAQVVAGALMDAGFEVVLGELFAAAADVCEHAKLHNVDVIGLSCLSGSHVELAMNLIRELRKRELDIPVVMGGNMDPICARALKSLGVAECFPTESSVLEIAARLARLVVDVSRAHCESQTIT